MIWDVVFGLVELVASLIVVMAVTAFVVFACGGAFDKPAED